ncbi:MAG: nucleoside deaminase [Roseovarius sp.]|nr:nucleoside deaminase [Roseovarius sp.]
MTDADFMARAIELSARALIEPGLAPYGAVVVRDGRIVGEGVNRSIADLDPTSHGETEAIRDACRNLGTTDLAGTTLYTSCEPCPLCVAAMLIAGVERMVYALSAEERGQILAPLRGGDGSRVDIARMRAQTGLPAGRRDMPDEQLMSEAAAEVMARWGAARAG